MSILTADPALQAYLRPLKEPTEIRAANGRLLGYCTPAGHTEAAPRLRDLFDPAELQRRKTLRQKGYTIEEVHAHLKSLEPAEAENDPIVEEEYKPVDEQGRDFDQTGLLDPLDNTLLLRLNQLKYGALTTPSGREIYYHHAAIDEAQKDVSGTARVKLYKGSCTLAGRKSKNSLYRLDIATFEEDDVYDQKDAAGFIRLNALRLKIRAQRRKVSS